MKDKEKLFLKFPLVMQAVVAQLVEHWITLHEFEVFIQTVTATKRKYFFLNDETKDKENFFF